MTSTMSSNVHPAAVSVAFRFSKASLTYLFKKKELTPSTDLDSDLRLEDDEALALMDDFFTTFNVDRGSFSITTYYPPEPPLKHLLNPFRKNDIPQVPDFTIGMLISSARSGRWLYD